MDKHNSTHGAVMDWLRRAGALLALSALLVALLFSFAPAPRALAASCASLATGPWDSPSTWSCAKVPFGADDVTVSAGTTVTIPSSSSPMEAYNLTIASGGTLTVTGSTVLVLSSDFDVAGTFNPGSGVVDFHSSDNQFLYTHGGLINFYTLTKTANFVGAVLIDPGLSGGGIHVQNRLGGLSPTYTYPPPDASNYLKLFSASNNQWRLAPQGGLSVDYVSVQGSNNQGTTLAPVHGVYHGNGNNTNWTLHTPVSTAISLYSNTDPGHPNQPVTFRTKTYNASGTTIALNNWPTGNVAFYTFISNNLALINGCQSLPATPYTLPPPYPLPLPPSPLPSNAPYSETPCQTTFPALGNIIIRAYFTGTGVYADSQSNDFTERIMIPIYLPLIMK